MKEYKIDLSMYEGKVREVVSDAVQTKAFALGYSWWAQERPTVISPNCCYLFLNQSGFITRKHERDIRHFSERDMPEISAADFLALTPEDVRDEIATTTEPADAPEFRPFDKVLVRDSDGDEWGIDLFASFSADAPYSFQCLLCEWKQCIPYEGNEHLLGTTEDV